MAAKKRRKVSKKKLEEWKAIRRARDIIQAKEDVKTAKAQLARAKERLKRTPAQIAAVEKKISAARRMRAKGITVDELADMRAAEKAGLSLDEYYRNLW